MSEPGHTMIEIPQGKSVADMLPEYIGIKNTLGPIGAPLKVCACCEKPFTVARKPRLVLRMYPTNARVPISFLYRICGQCKLRYRAGGADRDEVLAAIQKFMMGGE